MSHAFVSYFAKDTLLAHWLRDQLILRKVDVFLAEVSINPGERWKPAILQNLHQAECVILLATPSSCASDAVKHELGGALALNKLIMAGMVASELPKWIRDRQAIDIEDDEKTRGLFEQMARTVTSREFIQWAILIGTIVGLILWAKKR